MPTIKIESETQLQEELQRASGPVVLAFQKDGCEPCDNDKPNLAEVQKAHPELTVLTIDVEAHDDIAEAYGADATPTYLVGKDPKKCSTRSRDCKEVPWAADLERALKR